MKLTFTPYVWRAVILLGLALTTAGWADTKVMLPDEARFSRNEENIFVETTIPGNVESLEGIIVSLLTKSGQAANTKLSNPFVPKFIASTSPGDGAQPLAASFKGARKRGKNVILSFDGEAMRYLNSTVSIQEFVKGAIEKTIRLHFPTTKDILYEVDGKIVRGWDA